MKICYIMRGVPGSGKSTVADRLALIPVGNGGHWWESFSGEKGDRRCIRYFGSKDEEIILSATHSTDFYFINEFGEYKFDRARLGTYHSANFKAFRKSCEDGIGTVIVDNTNLTRNDWKKYTKCAKDLGYLVVMVELPIPSSEEAAERNVHGVSQADIERMSNKWEPFNGKI